MNEARKVIAILGGINLTEQNVYRTGVEFLEKEFTVVVIDCRLLLGYQIDFTIRIDARFKRVYEVSSLNEFVRVLDMLKPAYALDFIGPCREMRTIQPALRNAGCKFVIQRLGSLPQPNKIERRFNQFLGVIARMVIAVPSGGIPSFSKGDKKSTGIPPGNDLMTSRGVIKDYIWRRYYGRADLALAAGRKSIGLCSKLAKTTLSVRSTDAHLYIQALRYWNSERLIGNREYVVFIDDALVHATDWALLGIRPLADANDYFVQLNSYFSQIEKAFDVQVVIAGHPQLVDNKEYVSSFAGRTVRFKETPELIFGCMFAVAHCSTAVSFAVMSEKPIMILSSKGLNRRLYGSNIRYMARALGVKMVLMDNHEMPLKRPTLCVKNYAKYIEDFLFEGKCTEDEPWQIFSSYVNETEV